MGFLASYRRLSKKQKIAFGVGGMVFAIIAPYFTDNLQVFFEEQQRREKTLKENMENLQLERRKESMRQYEMLREKHETKTA